MTVLALDISGVPRQWISTDDAITYHAKQAVAWSLGDVVARYHGGIQEDGRQSYLETPSIIAIRGHGFNPQKHARVGISNRTLFGRDRNICAYCAGHFPNFRELSRDHIIPRSRGGPNTWMNIVTSCRKCNAKKGDRLLKEVGMELVYVPYVPCHYENLILQSRTILADQMDYLMAGLPRNSRVLKELRAKYC
ncbi:MAG: HNH endonuclease [Micrococcales bacterium]|nr:HNH endonuclease [Micrococcales bacterium]